MSGKSTQQYFSTYLRTLHKSRKLSLRLIAKKSGVSNSYICQIENGKRDIPTLPIIVGLAKAYGVSVQSLIDIALMDVMGATNVG